MKISDLVAHLEKVKEEHGDVEVTMQIDYFCGDYGGHNCSKKGAVEWIHESSKKVVLNGYEDM